jgi:hypothetical protein
MDDRMLFMAMKNDGIGHWLCKLNEKMLIRKRNLREHLVFSFCFLNKIYSSATSTSE